MNGLLLQWNQNAARGGVLPARRTSLLTLTSSLVTEHQPWLVTLQEMVPGADTTLTALGYQVHVHSNGSMCTAWNSSWAQNVTGFFEHPRCMLIVLDSSHVSRSLALWNIHLRSRLHARDNAIAIELNDLFTYEVAPRRKDPAYSTCLEVFAGDFNLQPYDDIFWQIRANRCRTWAQRKGTQSGRWLYNPSWELLNAQTPTGGTFYYRNADDSPWYVFDQALMSPEFGSTLPARAVTQAGGVSLANGWDHKPDKAVASDHFPVVVPCQL